MKKIIAYFAILFLVHIHLHGQTNSNKMIIIAKAKSNKVMLRWTPPNASAYETAIANGYQLYRRTVARNGQTLTTPEITNLGIIKPIPQNSADWIPYNKLDSLYHYSAYNLLYVNRASWTPESKYFSMNVATMLKYKAAEMAGLGYTDLTALTNERYIYTVGIVNYASIDTAGVFTYNGIPSETLLTINKPKVSFTGVVPKKKSTDAERRVAKVTWNADSLKKIYAAYWVERSINGGNYVQLNAKPFMNLGGNKVKELILNDTIPNTRVRYLYRIKGKTYFDEFNTSTFTEALSSKELNLHPSIRRTTVLNNGSSARIDWVFPADTVISRADTLIKGFIIEKSTFSDSLFTKVGTLRPSTDTTATVILGAITEYFRVSAISNGNDTLVSLPVIIQKADNTPPARPTGVQVSLLNGTTNSVQLIGSIKIQWTANTEPDLDGYKVFRAIKEQKDTVLIHDGLIKGITFTDGVLEGVEISQLTYFVMAVDKNGNQSPLSLPAIYQVSDKKPPLPPVFLTSKAEESEINLVWKKSPSTDVIKHTLFRKDPPSDIWNVVKVITNTDTTFSDKLVEIGKTYFYGLTAEDNAGNKSTALPIMVEMPRVAKKPNFEIFNATVDIDLVKIDLNWNYPSNSLLSYFELVRGASPAALTSWKSPNGTISNTPDYEVKGGITYKYAIRAVFKDGEVSNWKEISIPYPNLSTCTVEIRLIKNSKILVTTPIIDKACYEINLEDGFETNDNGEYTAEIINN